MKIWFTSDTHFGHASIIKYCNRPFPSTSEMDAKMIEVWNSQVSEQDEVWHLGDFSFGRSEWKADAHIIERLNGKKNIILGNHDNEAFHMKISASNKNWTVYKGHIRKTFQLDDGSSAKFILSHFPFREWDGFYHNSYHLYGHVHGKLPNYCRSMDVGVDTNNFNLYSLDAIINTLSPMTNKHA